MNIARNHGYLDGVGRIRLQFASVEVPRPRGVLVLVHGLSDHGGRYDGFAQAMAAHGFSTFALDLRGHGRSEGRRGHVRRFGLFLQDLERFRREVQGAVSAATPLFLMGVSMGGLVAVRYAQECEASFRGVILASPWLGTALHTPAWKIHLADALDRVLPAFPFPLGLRPEDLSHDPAVVRGYRADPLVHQRVTPRLFAEVNRAISRAYERADAFRAPVLFLLPGADRIVDTERSLAFSRAVASEDATVRVYPDFFHEVLLERDRRLALEDVKSWLVERVGARSENSATLLRV